MIPLRDSARTRKFPIVNISLIVLTVATFIYQETLSQEQLANLFFQYGLIPDRFLKANLLFYPGEIIPLFSSVFLHGGWLHLLGNMLYLRVFGDNIEERLGHGNYLLFYLAMGAVAGIAHTLANPLSPVPTVGASGAVAGILGAYFISFPHARVLTLIPIGFFITTAHLPAFLYLLFWFLLQIINAFMEAGMGAETVAWWAHIGGFGVGALFALIFPSFRSPNRERSW